jgi:hypothetical protein
VELFSFAWANINGISDDTVISIVLWCTGLDESGIFSVFLIGRCFPLLVLLDLCCGLTQLSHEVSDILTMTIGLRRDEE